MFNIYKIQTHRKKQKQNSYKIDPDYEWNP